MRHFLVVIAAASLALPTFAIAQTPPPKQQDQQQAPAAKPALRPSTRPAMRPNRPAAARPDMPRGDQAFHRGVAIARIHGPVFVYPRGWHYRRWFIGGIMPRLFLVQTYWYAEWSPIGLQAPPPGYAWVRFGPDLILVNLGTGAIEDVVYGLFY